MLKEKKISNWKVACFCIFLICLGLFTFGILIVRSIQYEQSSRPFDSQGWKTLPTLEQLRMARYIAESNEFTGMTETRLVNLLGDADRSTFDAQNDTKCIVYTRGKAELTFVLKAGRVTKTLFSYYKMFDHDP